MATSSSFSTTEALRNERLAEGNNVSGRIRLVRITSLLVIGVLVAAGAASGQQGRDHAIRSGLAATRGIRIHYLESGDASSPRALVLIPGWRLPSYLWDEQLKQFAPMMRVIAIDPRSQGASTKTQSGDTPESRAMDLHGLLSDLKVSQSVLVGWSQGAQDVAAYLQQFGTDSVLGVVFVDSPVSAGPAEVQIHPEFSRIIIANISSYASHPRQFSEGMVRSIFQQPHPEIDMQKLANFTMQTPVDTGIAMLATDIFGADRRTVLAKINKPVLVIASGESPMLGVEKQMAASIPRAKFVVISGAAHAVFVDQPEKFNVALKRFLQSLNH